MTPTQALWRAIDAHDRQAARRALFQGADPHEERPSDRWAPHFMQETPLLRVLLGHPELPYAPIDVPLLEVLLPYTSPTQTILDRPLTSFPLISQADNAQDVFLRLVQHGAPVHYDQLVAMLLIPASMLQGAALPMRESLMDAVWDHLSERDRETLRRRLPVMWAHVEKRLGEPPSLEGRRWLLQHGVALPEQSASPLAAPGQVVILRSRRPV